MRILKYLVALAVIVALLGAGMAALAVWHFGRGLPDYQQLADYQPSVVTRLHAGDGRLLAEYATRRPIGASTITQQVAKNFLLSSEVSLARKVKEALLAVKIERALSKDRILEL